MEAAIGTIGEVRWDYPWNQDWRAIGQQLERKITQGTLLCDALNAVGAAPVCFVPHTQLPANTAYEAYVHDTGCCPTRDGLHDFFNALC